LRARVGGGLVADERVGEVGELREEEQLVAAEAVAVLELLLLIHVGARELYAVVGAVLGGVFPDAGLDAAEAEHTEGRLAGAASAGLAARGGGEAGGGVFHRLRWRACRGAGAVPAPLIPKIGDTVGQRVTHPSAKLRL